jgi:6-phosphogluconolactonase
VRASVDDDDDDERGRRIERGRVFFVFSSSASRMGSTLGSGTVRAASASVTDRRRAGSRPRMRSRTMAVGRRIATVDDGEACAKTLGTLVREMSAEAIAKRGTFSIALAGGSLVKMLCGLDAGDSDAVSWKDWRVFWVDERCVGHDDEESNYGGAMRTLFRDVAIPRENLFAIDETLCPTNSGSATRCAEAYEKDLRGVVERGEIELNADGLPVFDALLLGFGPDGHICSLFPNHELLDRSEAWILPIADSPKPPPERITFSLPVVNAARTKVFVAVGEGKADMTARILQDAPQDGSIPAALVKGDVRWIVDKAASQKLNSE